MNDFFEMLMLLSILLKHYSLWFLLHYVFKYQ